MKPVCLSAEARPFGRAGGLLQLPGSPYPRRFALLVSAGVQLGCLICVDTDGHLEKIPAQTWELVERILAKQLFVEASRQDKPLRPQRTYSCICWTAAFPLLRAAAAIYNEMATFSGADVTGTERQPVE